MTVEPNVEVMQDTINSLQKQVDNKNKEIKALELAATNSEIARKATQEDFERLQEKAKELEEALSKYIRKEGFTPASQLADDVMQQQQQQQQLWIPTLDAIKIFVALRKARDTALDKHQDQRKVLFSHDQGGRLTGAELEAEDEYLKRLKRANV